MTAGVTATMSARASRSRARPATADSSSLARSTTTVRGPLLPGAELGADQVVGPARGELGGLAARVLRPGAHVERRHGQGEHDDRGRHRPQERTLGDLDRPPGRERHTQRLGDDVASDGATACATAGPTDCAGQQTTTGEPAQHRHQRQRGGHHAQHGDAGGEAERAVDGQPGEAQPHQRDQHGAGREDDRASGRGGSATGRLGDAEPLGEVLGVPGDQQQRVVDADAEADHGRDHRGGGADVGGGGEQGDAGAADAEPDQRGADRQAGADHGPEGEDQDDEGGDDADDLAATLHRGGRALGQLAAELDLEHRWPATVRRRPRSGSRLPIRSGSVTGAS